MQQPAWMRVAELLRHRGPMTAKQAAMELGIPVQTVQVAIKVVRERNPGVFVVDRWAGVHTPFYRMGPGEDAARETIADRVLDLLFCGGPATRAKLCELTGESALSVGKALRLLMRKGRRRVHICGWKRRVGQRGREAPVYAAGGDADAPRPDFSQASREHYVRRLQKAKVERRMAAVGRRLAGGGANVATNAK